MPSLLRLCAGCSAMTVTRSRFACRLGREGRDGTGGGGEVRPARGRRSRTVIRAGRQARAVAVRPAARLGRFLVRGAALAALAALKVLTGALGRLALVATYRVALLAAI